MISTTVFVFFSVILCINAENIELQKKNGKLSIQETELFKSKYQNTINPEKLKIAKELLDEFITLRKNEYVQDCGTSYRIVTLFLEKEFMNFHYTNRTEILQCRDHIITEKFDKIYFQENHHLQKDQIYRLALEKYNDTEKDKYNNHKREKWTLFLTWLTNTKEWMNEDKASRLLSKFEQELQISIKKGYTIDFFVNCVIDYWPKVYDKIKILPPNDYIKELVQLRNVEHLYEVMIQTADKKTENEMQRNKEFISCYCAKLLWRIYYDDPRPFSSSEMKTVQKLTND